MLTRDCSRRALFGATALGVLSLRNTAPGQEPATGRASTVILLRHAEKDAEDPTDPGLTERGLRRAEALASALRAAGVTKLYATDYRRTKATLQPLSELLELPIASYPAARPEDLVAKLQQAAGEVAVVVGHSNTVPALVEALGGRLSDLDARGFFREDEYDRLVVQALWAAGPGDALRAIQTIELRLDC